MSAQLLPLLLEDQNSNAVVTLGVQGGCIASLQKQLQFLQSVCHVVLPLVVSTSHNNPNFAGHEVPLSVALDHDSPVLPMEILGNTSQQYLATNHSSDSGELRILVAVTSTCCTLQVSWPSAHVLAKRVSEHISYFLTKQLTDTAMSLHAGTTAT